MQCGIHVARVVLNGYAQRDLSALAHFIPIYIARDDNRLHSLCDFFVVFAHGMVDILCHNRFHDRRIMGVFHSGGFCDFDDFAVLAHFSDDVEKHLGGNCARTQNSGRIASEVEHRRFDADLACAVVQNEFHFPFQVLVHMPSGCRGYVLGAICGRRG